MIKCNCCEPRMYPIILLANNLDSFDDFLENYKKEHHFSPLQTQVITPEKTTLTINQIRELKKELKISAAKSRLIIFQHFDTATNEAQNALLKVLEEQNTKNQFIMLATQLGNILPTIISRSRVIDLVEESTVYDEHTTSIIDAFLKQPNITYLSEDIFTVSTKEEASILLKICIERMHKQLHTAQASYTNIIKKTFDLLYKLEHNNLSPQLTVDHWIILVTKSLQ